MGVTTGGGVSPSTAERISTETLAADGNFASVTIPSYYQFIRISITGYSTGGSAQVRAVINSDAGANYQSQILHANGTTVSTSVTGAVAYLPLGQTNGINNPCTITAVLANNNALMKTGWAVSGENAHIYLAGLNYLSTSYISTIAISAAADTWKAGSCLEIWGER